MTFGGQCEPDALAEADALPDENEDDEFEDDFDDDFDFAEEDKACPPLQQGGQDFSPLTLETSMAEINFAETGLYNGGAAVIAAWMAHKDTSKMTSLNISGNLLNFKELGASGVHNFVTSLLKCQ